MKNNIKIKWFLLALVIISALFFYIYNFSSSFMSNLESFVFVVAFYLVLGVTVLIIKAFKDR